MCTLMSPMPTVMSLVIFLAPKCRGGGLYPSQFFISRDTASCPRYLSIGVFHPQNFLIYITGLFIFMLVRERSLKTHIHCNVSLKLGW